VYNQQLVAVVPPSTGLLAYQRLLSDATDDVAFVKQAQVPGLTESGYVFTTLEDRANRIYVTVNPDYYDRSLSKSAPQHILIKLKRASQHRRPGLPVCHRASSVGDSSHSERAAPLTIGLVQKMD
jgi:hypothetical protein